MWNGGNSFIINIIFIIDLPMCIVDVGQIKYFSKEEKAHGISDDYNETNMYLLFLMMMGFRLRKFECCSFVEHELLFKNLWKILRQRGT